MAKRFIDAELLKKNIRVNLMPNVDIDGTVTVENAERYFLNLIDKTPTADVVEVRHGKWKKPQFVGRSGFREVRDFICGICGKEYAVEQPCNLMNYCPNCGARMDGDEDDL